MTTIHKQKEDGKMAKQIAFTKHEAALLLDAYLRVLSGELSRIDSVKECSRMLRLMAINSGMEIDDIYRNVNGISFQMASMESAYQGRTIMKPATRLFTEMVYLYKTDNKEFQKLLKEAKNMAEKDQNNEAMFMSWLSKNVSSAQLSELYMALIEIEQQAKKVRLIKGSLYDNLDPSSVKKIKANVEQSKIFKYTHKRQWSRILSALNYLLKYVKEKTSENIVVDRPSEDAFPKSIADSASAKTTQDEHVITEDRQYISGEKESSKKDTVNLPAAKDAIASLCFLNISCIQPHRFKAALFGKTLRASNRGHIAATSTFSHMLVILEPAIEGFFVLSIVLLLWKSRRSRRNYHGCFFLLHVSVNYYDIFIVHVAFI